ncbi:MFS transporter, CP family, cyanate transporter [Actinomyces denticolens]|uniref:MFS transporter, CP family, cyanate transporter n=1 Tax=Actinomyces denticolens TaxID=52767 RepID=A0ABY1I6D0_9ACTO|nr:MFS transporter [Actinomyces denticolens]SHI56829.1 MFS transporter, CP family, cyanate transporter [Actinomyces denticolens]
MSGVRLPRRAWLAIIVLGFLGLCAVLRVPVGVIPPLLERLGDDLGLSGAARGALTSVPVLCFGLLTPVASLVVRRMGVNASGLVMMSAVVAGAVLRSAGGAAAAFAGTVLIGAGLTIGNLVAPMVIGRDFWHRASLMTGLYSATCNVLVTAATALAVPLAAVIGWRGSALAWTVIPVVLAAAAWWWVYPPGSTAPREGLRQRSGMSAWVGERSLTGGGHEDAGSDRGAAGASGRTPMGGPVWRRPLAWVMALAFTGHVLSFYAISGWLPTALAQTAGMSESAAGLASSVFAMTGIAGPMLVPLMLEALGWSGARMLGVLSACWLALPVAMIVAPTAWLVPCLLSGIAQGAFFAALFSLVIQRAESLDDNRRTTALIQTVGYCAAAVGPIVVGWMREATGGWVAPFAVVVAALVLMTVCGQIAARWPAGGASRVTRPADLMGEAGA